MNLIHLLKSEPPKNQNLPLKTLKVLIAPFVDNCAINGAQALCHHLNIFPFIKAEYQETPFEPEILILDGRRFYDLFEKGRSLLKRAKADVLIWGLREENMIRLNFQTLRQYEKTTQPCFSLLQGLYLPVSYFQEDNLPQSVMDLLAAVLLTASENLTSAEQKTLLTEVVSRLEEAAPPSEIKGKYLPYIHNLLALVYISAQQTLQEESIQAAEHLLEKALHNALQLDDSLLLSHIYNNFGLLYERASEEASENRFEFCKRATESRRFALKYFKKHSFPYDYGYQCYRLSKLYNKFWKYTSDTEALRESLQQLREAEKIFSSIVFPFLWAQIETNMGKCLAALGNISKNDEISMRAVECYRKAQKILTRETHPLAWAETEADIGNIYLFCGKIFQNEPYLNEALQSFEKADEIYENQKKQRERKQLQKLITQANQYLSEQIK